MNLGDPELELIDPTPNVHALFIQFDKTFFWGKLASRAVVRWSKRMYSCAGICSYEGRGGLCDIALSEPLLKLRPRKDVVETLLHEMIHAYLFITQRVQDRDGHGPNFKEHMSRINMAAGINISIYHDFHDEVELYQTHWWRCNGPCQLRRPHFGIVRRPINQAPGPREYWWADHQKKCGGTFVKIKEPEKKNKKTAVAKPMGDITKYITNTQKTIIPPLGGSKIVQIKDINTKSKVQTKSNNSSTVVVTQKGVYSPVNVPVVKPPIFAGKGNILPGPRVRSNSVDVSEAVRNIWAKKQFTSKIVSPIAGAKGINSSYIQKPSTNITPNNVKLSNNIQKAIKHKANSVHVDSPPVKVKKIDDYFKANATSLLKDIYGSNIEIVESHKNNKLIAVDNTNTNSWRVVLVDCPICKLKFEENKINSHLDECLNKDIIAEICNNSQIAEPEPKVQSKSSVNVISGNDKKKVSKQVSKEIMATLPPIPAYRPKLPPEQVDPDGSLDYNTMKKDLDKPIATLRGTLRNETKHWDEVIKEPTNLDVNINWNNHLKSHIPKIELDPVDVDRAEIVVKKVQIDKHVRNSDNFDVPAEQKDIESGYLPSFTVEEAKVIKLPPAKIEPGTSIAPALTVIKCPCCGNKVTKPIHEHLDECLSFFATDTAPEEPSTSFANHTIIIDDDDDDDDIFDESQVFNDTGTKLPCPCCLEMVENNDMNAHLDNCLK